MHVTQLVIAPEHVRHGDVHALHVNPDVVVPEGHEARHEFK